MERCIVIGKSTSRWSICGVLQCGNPGGGYPYIMTLNEFNDSPQWSASLQCTPNPFVNPRRLWGNLHTFLRSLFEWRAPLPVSAHPNSHPSELLPSLNCQVSHFRQGLHPADVFTNSFVSGFGGRMILIPTTSSCRRCLHQVMSIAIPPDNLCHTSSERSALNKPQNLYKETSCPNIHERSSEIHTFRWCRGPT